MAQPANKPAVASAATPISEPSTSDLSRQVEVLKADIAKLTDTISSLGKQKASETKEELELRAQMLKERGKVALDHAGTEIERLASDAERTVREKPLTALAIAAGIGIVLGMLSRK